MKQLMMTISLAPVASVTKKDGIEFLLTQRSTQLRIGPTQQLNDSRTSILHFHSPTHSIGQLTTAYFSFTAVALLTLLVHTLVYCVEPLS